MTEEKHKESHEDRLLYEGKPPDNVATMRELGECQKLLVDLRGQVEDAKRVGDLDKLKRLQQQINAVYVWGDRVLQEFY